MSNEDWNELDESYRSALSGALETAHPAVEQADVAAKLTFINGRPAMCGCQVEYSDGGGEYSDVIYVTLCAKHSGSAILDLVATNRIALTPEYEGQWHADLYLDREIPLAKVEGATPAEAVLALMSAERIDPEQESVEQAGGDERAAFELFVRKHCGMPEHIAVNWDAKFTNDAWEGWQARAALAQPSPDHAVQAHDIPMLIASEHANPDYAMGWNDCRAKIIGASSAVQAEQAEAERPEVVASVVHSNPVVLGQCGPLNANDELMTVAQHAASVARWAEMFNRVEQQRDAALARVAELEKELAMALDAASKGEGARHAAGGMEMEIRELKAKLAELEKPVNRTVIRDVFLRNGFTIKDGHSDLKPYVYAAAEELLRLGGHAVDSNPVAQAQHSAGYAEARQCVNCRHIGINDAADYAACHDCRWTGPEPDEDKCPGCGSENCMAAACPECGGRYDLVAEASIATPVAQAQQLNDLDKQCRDDVARALGLRPNQERGFAWSYLLASIKSCVKASGDSAQAQHSVPGDIMRDAQRYRWLRDQQFYFSFSTENSDAGISSCTAGMSSRFKNLSWVDAAIDSAIAAAPGKEGV
ncbi:TPA: hypothetical protein NIH14_001817 [Pseudomonas aeruginosa]|nr:hypothetical protein [Pseudomonas aeruginosa]